MPYMHRWSIIIIMIPLEKVTIPFSSPPRSAGFSTSISFPLSPSCHSAVLQLILQRTATLKAVCWLGSGSSPSSLSGVCHSCHSCSKSVWVLETFCELMELRILAKSDLFLGRKGTAYGSVEYEPPACS